jgi:hypothetical protein
LILLKEQSLSKRCAWPGLIVQFLSSIVNLMTAVDLLQKGIFCHRKGIFSIMAAIQESMIKSAENVLVTNAYIIIFVSGFEGSVSILIITLFLHPFLCLHHIKVLEWAVPIIA